MRHRMALTMLTAILLAITISGCSVSGRKTHLISNSPYVDARTGQLIEEDDDDDGIVGAFFDFIWCAIFGSEDDKQVR